MSPDLHPKSFGTFEKQAPAPITLAKKVLALDVVPFQRKLGAYLAKENGSSLLWDIISVFHSLAKQAQREGGTAFLFYCMPDSCIVFGCNSKMAI